MNKTMLTVAAALGLSAMAFTATLLPAAPDTLAALAAPATATTSSSDLWNRTELFFGSEKPDGPASISSPPSASISRWPEFLGEAWDGAKQFAGGIGTVVDAVKHDGLDTFDDFSGSVKREQARDELKPSFQGSTVELEAML